ncbi:hypothetical protein QC764_401335 [Podospora pseudoanserina]|uniref:Uncharacterized protein n=1 Tax=Podospora pseudoanserina TaxID=2609844 RepID=A0ABR0I843_9PEZI|nr:hypothetical protein QC764_401335 [Podospora pseudoanserina]
MLWALLCSCFEFQFGELMRLEKGREEMYKGRKHVDSFSFTQTHHQVSSQQPQATPVNQFSISTIKMFQLKTLITLLALGGFSAMAAPTENVPVSEHSGISRREDASVYACEHINYLLGLNTKLTAHHEINFTSNWDNKISDIKNNNKNALKCRWYVNRNCQGSSYHTQEDQKLNDGNGNFNDSISSWKCCHKGGCFGNRVVGNSTEIENSNAEIKAHV